MSWVSSIWTLWCWSAFSAAIMRTLFLAIRALMREIWSSSRASLNAIWASIMDNWAWVSAKIGCGSSVPATPAASPKIPSLQHQNDENVGKIKRAKELKKNLCRDVWYRTTNPSIVHSFQYSSQRDWQSGESHFQLRFSLREIIFIYSQKNRIVFYILSNVIMNYFELEKNI